MRFCRWRGDLLLILSVTVTDIFIVIAVWVGGMGKDTSIPCDTPTRDRIRELKQRGEKWRSYDDILEEMADAYENQV